MISPCVEPDYADAGIHNAGACDKIILIGTMADHGMAILTQRQSLALEAGIVSDTAALNHMAGRLLSVCKPGVHVLRDPTRAEIIGEVVSEEPGTVVIETRIGGRRIVDMRIGSQLPGIC